jgi:hypothetical protein
MMKLHVAAHSCYLYAGGHRKSEPWPMVNVILSFLRNLRFRQLFLLTLGLFVLDLIVPDFIPFIDELLLGLLTLLFAIWRKPDSKRLPPPD